MRRDLIATVGLIGAVGLLTNCGGEMVPETQAGAAAALTPFHVTDSTTESIPVELPGQLYVEHDAAVVARTEGIVDSVYVDLGRWVKEGQLLAKLESIDQEIARDQARQSADNARRVFERARELAQSGHVSPADSELASYDYEKAGLELRQAERDYDLTRVTAPFAGMVTARLIRPRRHVTLGDSLFQVTAMAPLLVSVRAPEGSLGGGSDLSDASVEVVSADGRRHSAHVLRASPVFDAASGTREIVLRVGPKSGLKPGARVNVRLGTSPRRVLAIPREYLSDQGYVLVVEQDRTVMRQVRAGGELADGQVEIESGLAAGERLAPVPQ
jgi:RND family efflux transporter MFP subunit